PSRSCPMRTSVLCIAFIFTAAQLDAAPAPDPSIRAKEKFEALKKKLPDILTEWSNSDEHARLFLPTRKPELRLLRRIAPNRAKAVIHFVESRAVERAFMRDMVLTVFLTYQDGCWTTETFEAFTRVDDLKDTRWSFSFLMTAIDEAAAK